MTSSSKPIIILIHGGASSSRMYEEVVPLLSPSYTVIAPDLPGHGTKTGQGPFTFEAAVTSITECILSATSDPSRTATPEILLVGISLGGQSVLAFLQQRPDLVTAAIVSGVSIHPPDENTPWEMPHLPSGGILLDILTEGVGKMGKENLKKLQAVSLGFTFPMVGTGRGGGADTAGEGAGEDETSGSVSKTVIKGFPPVLVMIGERDMKMQRRDFNELTETCKRLNGKSRGLVLKGAWHNHSIDVPELFADAVRKWAERIL